MKLIKKKTDKTDSLNIELLKSEYYDKGYDDGISDGDYDARIEVAKNLLKTKLSKHEILKVTGVSPQILKDLSS